ncbi:MAG: ATP-dependent Clp protease proteolytic subunit [Patescibacteria group bacterium]|nr:ATP-dependent Clp protease proteolytic subunit [Patescibacteria group bacterium]MDE1945920.1 ATP-dependent Clp protease proteolytic subunit [Patescibacteria group bacterium]
MDPKSLDNGKLEALLKKNVFPIVGDIDGKILNLVQDAFSKLYIQENPPDILVLLSSPGGSVKRGLFVYDLLRLYPGKKTAIVVGEASSMGAIILQACDKRYATENAWILIHNLTNTEIKLDQLRDKAKLEELLADNEKLQAKQYAIIAKRTGKSMEEIREVFAKDKSMDVSEAVAFGLLDGIWDQPLPK